MNHQNIHSPSNNLISRQINLSDFGFEKPVQKILKQIKKDINQNKLLKFIQYT